MSQEIADQIIKSVKKFDDDLKNNAKGERYKSWVYCYIKFAEAIKSSNKVDAIIDYDYLSLHLAFYLASWGMYRGSSFLLWTNYKVHIPIVEEVIKPKYEPLHGIDCKELQKKDNLDLLQELIDKIDSYYAPIRDKIYAQDSKQPISDTLKSKILLGTLGCVPAFDQFFISGVKKSKVAGAKFNTEQIQKIAKFYCEYEDQFENVRKTLEFPYNYPQMKFLDMAFWQMGFEMQQALNTKVTKEKEETTSIIF